MGAVPEECAGAMFIAPVNFRGEMTIVLADVALRPDAAEKK